MTDGTDTVTGPEPSTADTDPPPKPKPKLHEESQIGIGGKGGLTYNVNRLKRNLVQEAVRRYKSDLVAMLDSSDLTTSSSSLEYSRGWKTPTRREIVEEKIAALVESNPVLTEYRENVAAEERFWNSGPWKAVEGGKSDGGDGDGESGGRVENPLRTSTRFLI